MKSSHTYHDAKALVEPPHDARRVVPILIREHITDSYFSLFALPLAQRVHRGPFNITRPFMRPAHIRDTYDVEWDFPVWNGMPCLEYMLAALPRSGSTYLASKLWQTGVMGSPMEYANPSFRDGMLRRFLRTDDLLDYWQEVKRHRTSPNGVFGFKMFTMGYVRAAHESPAFLAQIAPTKVIFLTRSDQIAQAVSYSKAIRSGAWFNNIRARSNPDYDFNHIQRCIVTLQYQIDFWKELFALTGTCVHHVTYEAILKNPRAVIKGIADFLDVQLDSRSIVDLPYMSIQRDAESAEWVKRFKTELCVVSPDLEKNVNRHANAATA